MLATDKNNADLSGKTLNGFVAYAHGGCDVARRNPASQHAGGGQFVPQFGRSSSVEAMAGKPVLNGRSIDAEASANGCECQSFLTEPSRFMQAPPLLAVPVAMFRSLHNHQILNPVVRLVMIYVMDVLCWVQGAAKVIFHNTPVLHHYPAVYANKNIASAVKARAFSVFCVTAPRAKCLPLGKFIAGKSLPAVMTFQCMCHSQLIAKGARHVA